MPGQGGVASDQRRETRGDPSVPSENLGRGSGEGSSARTQGRSESPSRAGAGQQTLLDQSKVMSDGHSSSSSGHQYNTRYAAAAAASAGGGGVQEQPGQVRKP